MRPQFSIIIPTYNAEATLLRCIESIKIQVFQDFEIVQIDGKSTDNTLTISQKLKKEFNNYHLISEFDKGIYDAMNKGIKLAKGKWLYFLGSDDSLFDELVLKKISKEIDKNVHSDIIYGNVMSSYYGGKYDGEFSYKKLARQNICHQSIFFNRSVFDKVGNFSLKYSVVADWDHNIRWFFNSRIECKYVDVLVANFAEGGFSSQNNDSLFELDKNFKLLRLGFYKLSFFELRRLCKEELEKLKAYKNIFNFLYLNSYLFVIRGRRKWENLIKFKT